MVSAKGLPIATQQAPGIPVLALLYLCKPGGRSMPHDARNVWRWDCRNCCCHQAGSGADMNATCACLTVLDCWLTLGVGPRARLRTALQID